MFFFLNLSTTFFQFENPVVEKAGSALALITDTCDWQKNLWLDWQK